MKKIILLTIIILAVHFVSFAQTGASYTYLNQYQSICSQDSGVYLSKFYKDGDTWHRKNYLINTGRLYYECTYREDENEKLYALERKYYYDSGMLYRRDIYREGKLKNSFFYYPDGKINGGAVYNNDGEMIKQRGYDTSGNILRNYYFEKEAEFELGKDAWRSFVMSNFKPVKKQVAKKGNLNTIVTDKGYRLNVSFFIDDKGNVDDIKTDTNIEEDIKEAVVSLIKKSATKWSPAIENNKNITSRKTVTIAYKVDQLSNMAYFTPLR